jgi:hypothetical protein
MIGIGLGAYASQGGDGNPIPALNPVFWVDAAQNVTESGGAVSAWGNLGTGSTDATQGSGSAQPTYNATGFGTNSLPYIDFNGSNHFLTVGTEYSKLANHTVITISQTDDITISNQTIIGEANGSGNTQTTGITHQLRRPSGTTFFQNLFGDGSVGSVTRSTEAMTANPQLLTDTYANGDTETVMYLDGVGLTENGIATSASSIGGTAFNLSIGRIGEFNGNYLNGKVAEVIIFDSVLGSSDLTAVHNFLISKYGL